ncbi:lytic transglycosylase domain-containing protein [Alsobacter sp. KACC 23698]|uniref:Lytic transglycosylase domain-containing protein n=1 Tax=Alsobacter sp. KACC 23698 TaxID=3149229 RepID=A0AAU7JB16_9HYPH
MKSTIGAAILAACAITGVSATHASASLNDTSSPLAVLMQEARKKEAAAAEAPVEKTQVHKGRETRASKAERRAAARLARAERAREARAARAAEKASHARAVTEATKAADDKAASAKPIVVASASATDLPTASAAVEAAARASGKEHDAVPGKASRHGKALGFDAEARGGIKGLIAKHAAANGIPFALADAVVRIESRYNPGASNGGAVGLMQIKPQTARGLGYSGGAAGLKNAETNLTYGMKYLAQAYRMSGGNTCATVMRYQSGHYAQRINAANRAYCGKARAIMASN